MLRSHPLVSAKSLSTQRGVTLVVALIFLAVLTLLGVAAMMGTTLQERMARNARDYNIALQAAEAALRDARKEFVTQTRTREIFKVTGFASDCTNGLCDVGGTNPWKQYLISNGVSYGSRTLDQATTVATRQLPASGSGQLASPPMYVIEALPDPVNGNNVASRNFLYRITAVGYGSSSNTQVILQEVFRPEDS